MEMLIVTHSVIWALYQNLVAHQQETIIMMVKTQRRIRYSVSIAQDQNSLETCVAQHVISILIGHVKQLFGAVWLQVHVTLHDMAQALLHKTVRCMVSAAAIFLETKHVLGRKYAIA